MRKNKNGKFFDRHLNSRKAKMALSIYAGFMTLTCCTLTDSLNQKDYYSEYKEQKEIAEQLSGENENLNTTVTDLQNQLSELESANEQLSQINENQKETINNYQSQETTATNETVEKQEEQKVETPKVEQQKEETQTVQSTAPTLSQKNAVKQAESYLKFMPFSRTGLIKQLEYEGYSTTDATYAVDNIKVNWNEQCAKQAESYLEFMAFSRDGLYKQLEYEGFTHEQIEYGLQAVGY